ncbi:hypothetical protein ACIP5T_00155 [Microbacterium sp. NPDC088619]|uniref:hypothetical protein n=1 Tax=Microbacterium sp. NPDC088619 TaxID=3364196 RepID=UPI00381C64E8
MDWNLTIAGLSLVLTAATLWFVLLDRVERGRQYRRAAWDFRVSHTVHARDDRNTQLATVLRLTNTGGGMGTLIGAMIVGAVVDEEDNPLIPAGFVAGAFHEFRILPADLDNVWIWLAYSDTDDRRFAHALWIPAGGEGVLIEEHNRQSDGLGSVRSARRRALRASAAVGPGGVFRRAIRRDRGGWTGILDATADIARKADGKRVSL